MIELDRLPEAPASSRPPPRLLRRAGLLLSVALVLAVGGAAPVTSVLWQRLGVVPADAELGTEFAVVGDRLYTVETAWPGQWRVAAWSPDPMRQLWTTPVTGGRELPADVPSNGIAIDAAGDDLLVSLPSYDTVVLDAGTGERRWTSPTPVQTTAAGLGVHAETDFRAGAQYDPSSGDPGALFWSTDGLPYTEPPRRTTVHGIDLRTGERLWSDEEPGSVLALPVAGDASSIVVASAGHLARREVRTGEVQRETPLPAARSTLWVESVDGMLLVRQGSWERGGTVTAYSAETMSRLWQISEPTELNVTGACFDLVCGKDLRGLYVIDPETGAARWRVPPEFDLHAWGDEVLQVPSTGRGELALRDRHTGAARALGTWDEFFVRPGEPLVLHRMADSSPLHTFAVLAPGRDAVQPLGVSTESGDQCRAGSGLIACQGDAGIIVWSYRA